MRRKKRKRLLPKMILFEKPRSISFTCTGATHYAILASMATNKSDCVETDASIIGRCIEVETEPMLRAKIVRPKGRLLEIELHNRELASALLARTGTVVALEGKGMRSLESGEIVAFRAETLGPYEDPPVRQAFEELSALFGDVWKDVDPDAWVAQLRGK